MTPSSVSKANKLAARASILSSYSHCFQQQKNRPCQTFLEALFRFGEWEYIKQTNKCQHFFCIFCAFFTSFLKQFDFSLFFLESFFKKQSHKLYSTVFILYFYKSLFIITPAKTNQLTRFILNVILRFPKNDYNPSFGLYHIPSILFDFRVKYDILYHLCLFLWRVYNEGCLARSISFGSLSE